MTIRTYKTYSQSFSGDAPTLSDYNSFLEKISNDITSSKCGVLLIERVRYDSEEFNHYPYHAQSKVDSTNEYALCFPKRSVCYRFPFVKYMSLYICHL